MATEMSLRDALIMEYRMVQRCQASGDFYEGVRAMLVDKDRNLNGSLVTLIRLMRFG